MSVWSLACRQSVFQWYHSEKHLSEFYPQDGGKIQLALKLRHCHLMYSLPRPVSLQFSDNNNDKTVFNCDIHWASVVKWRQNKTTVQSVLDMSHSVSVTLVAFVNAHSTHSLSCHDNHTQPSTDHADHARLQYCQFYFLVTRTERFFGTASTVYLWAY